MKKLLPLFIIASLSFAPKSEDLSSLLQNSWWKMEQEWGSSEIILQPADSADVYRKISWEQAEKLKTFNVIRFNTGSAMEVIKKRGYRMMCGVCAFYYLPSKWSLNGSVLELEVHGNHNNDCGVFLYHAKYNVERSAADQLILKETEVIGKKDNEHDH